MNPFLETVKKTEVPFGAGCLWWLGQMGLLVKLGETLLCVDYFASPLPERLMKSLHLVQRECADDRRMYRDMLIRRKDYVLTELDKRFITELTRSRRACIADRG